MGKKAISIIFINPPGSTYRAMYYLGQVSAASALSFDNRLASIADLKVGLMDANSLSESMLGAKLARADPDYICITLHERSAKNTAQTMRVARKAAPRSRIIVTGPFATYFPVEAMKIARADVLLRGEVEKTLSQFIRMALNRDADASELGKIQGIYLGTKDRCFSFQRSNDLPRLSSAELDELETDWNLVKKLEKSGCGDGSIYVSSSRGCSGKCVFCSRVYGSAFRAETPTITAKKISAALDAFPEKKLVEFTDDSFLEDKARVLGLSKIFLETGISKKTAISFQARVDSFFKARDGRRKIDIELMEALRNLNVERVYLGVESLSQKELVRLGKGCYSKDDVFELYEALEKIGVKSVTAYFILSNLDTAPQDLLETLDGAERLYNLHPGLFGADVSVFLMPYRQTPEYNFLEKNNGLSQVDGVIELPRDGVVRKALLELSKTLMDWKSEKPGWDDPAARAKYGIGIIREAKKILLKKMQ